MQYPNKFKTFFLFGLVSSLSNVQAATNLFAADSAAIINQPISTSITSTSTTNNNTVPSVQNIAIDKSIPVSIDIAPSNLAASNLASSNTISTDLKPTALSEVTTAQLNPIDAKTDTDIKSNFAPTVNTTPPVPASAYKTDSKPLESQPVEHTLAIENDPSPILTSIGGPLLKEVTVTSPAEVSYEEIQTEIRALAEKSKEYNNKPIKRSSFRISSQERSVSGTLASASNSSNTSLRLSDFTNTMPIDITNITSNYGFRNFAGRGEFHPGIDFAAPTGTPIYSTASGTVIYAGWRNGYGNFIEIDHGNGLRTRYGHASALFVSKGDQVGKRQRIAAVGSTGRSTGPHLHFEVYNNGTRQNPSMYLAMLKNK